MVQRIKYRKKQGGKRVMFQLFKIVVGVVVICLFILGIISGVNVWSAGKNSKRKTRQKDKPEPEPARRDPSRTADREVQELARQLAELDRELEWMEQLEGYSKVFHGLLNPLQTLLGCARTLKVSGLNEVQRFCFLQDKSLKPLAFSARKFRQLPRTEEMGDLAEADWKEYLALAPEVLRGKIQNQEHRKNVKRYLKRDRELLLELEKAGLFRLAETADQLEDDELVSVGDRIEVLLRKYGIYALNKNDEELADLPALQESFNEGNSSMTACPGLFLLRDGKYELFASCNGIWV